MKYTINLIVVFDPEHRTLALNNNEQTAIELSKPACRVLNEFIKNYGANLSRETLLKNAWEDYGFPPSNPSLNNCISDLRKAFISLGIQKPVIITLPKIGLRMEADIHPTPKHKNHASVTSVEDVAEKAVTLIEGGPAATFPIATPERSIKKPGIPYILALITCLGTVGMALLIWTPSPQLKLIGTYQQCDIYSISKEPLPGSELRAKQILESEKLDCSQTRQDVFYTEERPNTNLFKITFLAICKKNQAGNDYRHCKTFKIGE